MKSTTRHGYKIVCPDGKVRHYPYGNRGDADFDAKHSTVKGCTKTERQQQYMADAIRALGLCPEGGHVVEPHMFDMPAPAGES